MCNILENNEYIAAKSIGEVALKIWNKSACRWLYDHNNTICTASKSSQYNTVMVIVESYI